MQPYQTPLSDLFPGSAGGRAIRDERGVTYLHELASAGGSTTRQRYGSEHFREIGRRGRAEQLRRRDEEPRTVQHWDGRVLRVIPWQPHSTSSYHSKRRRRPLLVEIEVGHE